MFPKKIFIFGLLIIGLLAYFLKNKSLDQVNSNRAGTKTQNKNSSENVVNQVAKIDKNNVEFEANQCVTADEKGWEYTKIVSVGTRTYQIIDCHKYKGCTELTEVEREVLDHEMKNGKIIKCP